MLNKGEDAVGREIAGRLRGWPKMIEPSQGPLAPERDLCGAHHAGDVCRLCFRQQAPYLVTPRGGLKDLPVDLIGLAIVQRTALFVPDL